MLFHTLLPNLKTGKNNDKKDTIINFCYLNNSSFVYLNEKNSFNKNLSKINNIIHKIFFNNKDKKKFILASKNTK